ncbi:GMC oxidoreductase [Polyporus arcularius HHB13444]|uniref:GMC oxidoreductase n=1 Tax=Polyporus arcularius HHB13444 TaxID=1314778 RepID=A0A5C3PJD3_9APHY|nr:GMC oxidoreductase [Polyporus arcularius HHB13444]
MIPERFSSLTFDYIIIGGGTAGLVVASRLSEDPAVTVGVIEAGEWHASIDGVNVPGMAGSTLGDPQFDWAFMSVPQKHANDRLVYQPRLQSGKGLGGSSAINLLGFNRGSAHEYDAIEAFGNPGWNWEVFLKYFKKASSLMLQAPHDSETTLPLPTHLGPEYKLEQPDPQWHGDSGPIVKAYSTHFATLHVPFIDALEKLGVPRNTEPNKGNNIGATTIYCSVDSRTATRSYAGNAYYEANAGRKNLVVLTNATVSRIIFNSGSTPLRATGVEFLNGDKKYVAATKGEVVLAAGAFQSPQILELSGIGNKDTLGKHGIETLIDLPSVGENLHDHPDIHVVYEIRPEYETVDIAREPELAAKQLELYKSQKGYLTSALAAVYAFLPTKAFATDEQMAKWKEMATHSVEEAPQGVKKQLETQLKWLFDPASAEGEIIPFPGLFLPSGVQPVPKTRYSSMLCAGMHPFSRGSVHISSADPRAPPAIDPNYFSNPLDLEILLALFKFALKLYDTDPIREAVVRRVAPTAEESSSDEALLEYIKNGSGCVYHPLGSASMLPREDGGVVDPALKVYGTANVRVVDASILPIQVAAHIQATVYAVAEKAADIIKASKM